MTSENEYRNAVRYLQNLLNGGLMGARGTSPLMTAIEACELQIPKHPISKSWSPNLCPHCNADLGRKKLKRPATARFTGLYDD